MMDSSDELPEVVQDFQEALEDLHENSKPAIDVLTVIAKENTDFAEDISNVLEKHIRTTRPEWRLPALLVLDSLVRHVGPPYSTYLARNLYDTYMEVYRHNGARVRHELEVILGTWKHPPQGSRDPRPVLPPDITGKIESAVTAFRNIAMRHQATSQYPHQIRQTPTPNPSPMDVADILRSVHQRTLTPTNINSVYTPPPIISPQSRPTPYQSTPPLVNQPDLQREVQQVSQDASLKSMLEPNNHDLKRLLETLTTLKAVLESTPLAQSTLQQMTAELSKIKARLHSQLNSMLANPQIAQVLPSHSSTPLPYPVVSTPPAQSVYTPPPAAAPPNLPPQVDIASLLNILQPQPQTAATPIPTATPVPVAAAAENSILSQLRAAGLLSATPTPPQAPPNPINPNSKIVTLDQESIKIRRPHLMRALINSHPDQCRQCGRRFESTEEGRRKKTRHLDWHFDVNSRCADSTRSGIVHRSPYLNERQWATLHEIIDQTEAETALLPAAIEAEPETAWVPQPSDASMLKSVCPICRDPFQSMWHEKTQQFVWMDAKRVDGKYYHASCWDEVYGGPQKGKGVQRGSTPVLGKRKLGVRA